MNKWVSLCLLFGVLWVPTAQAEESCEAVLNAAEESYRAGRIREVYPVAEACAEERNTELKIRALLVLAKTYLADDREEEAAATVGELLALDPSFAPAPNDPDGFRIAVRQVRNRSVTSRVATVSKVDEPLREAPASVLVVTAEEIARRGYIDLEEVLHDLPGFDISRGNGEVYSNIYMRGYRSDRSDRMLFLVDGIEQNDLHSNTVYLSRQLPVSNVDTIEVVYGPASTIYGADAFTGVISITTKSPDALVGTSDRRMVVEAQVGGGEFGTSFAELTLAGRTPNERMSWSVTGRMFRSDEQDLTADSDWNYDPTELEDLNYEGLLQLTDALGEDLAGVCLRLVDRGCEVLVDDMGKPVGIGPTVEAAGQARALDQALFDALGDEVLGFNDDTRNWSLDAKLRFGDLTLGLQSWRREEGSSPWYPDLVRSGTGNIWIPRQTNLYARYSHSLGRHVTVNLLSRFKLHELDDESSVSRLITFAGSSLNILDFAADVVPAFQQLRFGQSSNEFRNEMTFVYQPSQTFSLVSGLEIRNRSLQLDLKSEVTSLVRANDSLNTTKYFNNQIGDATGDSSEFGVFAQASWRLHESLKVVFGGRYDTMQLRNETSFLLVDDGSEPGAASPMPQQVELAGSPDVLTPRLALVYTRGDFVARAVYAEAFKEPSNFQKSSREPGIREFPSPDLDQETVRNVELSVSWQPRSDRTVEVDLYEAFYSEAAAFKSEVDAGVTENPLLALETFPIASGTFKNTGALEVRGAQVTAKGRFGRWDFFGNYTYTEPFSIDPSDDLGGEIESVDRQRIGDIAKHRFNFGANLELNKHWNFNLRSNWVGERPTGEGTTVPDNIVEEVDAYFVSNAAVTYSGFPAGTTWQLVVRNLFDADYDHPGVQRGGEGFASLLPQPGRAVYLRLLYKWDGR